MILVYNNPKNLPTAVFVKRPSRIANLLPPHLFGKEVPYEVAAIVELPKLHYENFINDLMIDRPFLDEYKKECYILPNVWHCILVRQNGYTDGILVMTEGGDYPTWAAYLPPAGTN
jgi:hypothetical protein